MKKHQNDSRGIVKKKYLKLLKKFKPEQILFACDIYSEENKNNNYPLAIKTFLTEDENIKQMLEGDFKTTKELTSAQKELT